MVADPMAPLSAHEKMAAASLLARADEEIARRAVLHGFDPFDPPLGNGCAALVRAAFNLRLSLKMPHPWDIRAAVAALSDLVV
jgi:hypothetical protein